MTLSGPAFAAQNAESVPRTDPACVELGHHVVTHAGTCVYCGNSRQHEGESAFAYPARHELPHDWPDDDVRTVPAALLIGMARAVHHAEIVTRRPQARCVGCRLIARLPQDLQDAIAADGLRAS